MTNASNTYLKRIDVTTEVQHRFASDLFGQGVDMCSGCGKYREDRSHVRAAPTYANAIAPAPAKNLGEQLDEIMAEMDAAYAERAKHEFGSPLYIVADEMLEVVYTHLRAWNAEVTA